MVVAPAQVNRERARHTRVTPSACGVQLMRDVLVHVGRSIRVMPLVTANDAHGACWAKVTKTRAEVNYVKQQVAGQVVGKEHTERIRP